MRQAKALIWLVGIPVFIAGCSPDDTSKTEKTSSQHLALTADIRISKEGILSYGAVVFAENPTTLMEAGDFHGYELDGKAGGNITIKMNASNCGVPDTVLDLFGPEDASGARTFLVENDDANLGTCSLDSQVMNFTLPVTGRYLIVATSFQQQGGNGHYKLQVTCNNNACVDPNAPTFVGSKIKQTDIDKGVFTPDELFEIGDFLFETVYRVEDGMGNALGGVPGNGQPRPNFRQFPNNVHFAAFGGPEAQSCITCHNLGCNDGAGDRNHNIFQIGDGINRSSGVPRNPPALLGNGFRQAIAAEMTADLQAQLAAAKAQAASTGVAVTKALSSKGVSFGSLVVNPGGTVNTAGSLVANPNVTVNTAGVVGVDADLIVKPFGWKGREATLRRFIEGSFRVHLGMQASPSIATNCATPNVNMFGNGPNCQDPDGDGVTNEITEGQLTAEAVYMGLRETPVRVPEDTSAAQICSNTGEVLFSQIGCATCHVPNMKLKTPVHVEPADTTGGAGIRLDLAVDNKDPHPAKAADGSITVEVFSDFKRHDVGAALADSKPFNQIAANQFITPPLWGVANSAPYLHDGRAPTLNDAILQHAGDALIARNAYAALSSDDQQKILEFLGTLGRVENVDGTCPVSHGPPSCTDPLFTNTPLDIVTNDTCPYDVCGLNGVWMGGGVPFRTLRLDGDSNERGFRIVSFQDRDKKQLRIDVQNDVLIGWRADNTQCNDLKESTLILQRTGAGVCPHVETIILKIIDVHFIPYLAGCSPPYQCATRLVPVYTFTATTGSGCPLEACRPGLNPDDNHLPNLAGDAVIFQGDLYDEDTYKVTITPTVFDRASNNPHGIFNIACLGSAVSKLHLLRQTSASQSPAIPVPNEYQRQALLRLLTADYCGSGNRKDKPRELNFTKNGVRINLKFNGQNGQLPPYQPENPEPGKGFEPDGGSIEARWDSTGATCIGTPRLGLSLLDTITTTCYIDHPQDPLEPCASSTKLFNIESQNPR